MRLVAVVQVAGGAKVCLLSDAAVTVRGEMQAEERVQLVYRQELWPISRSWILNRLADVKQPGALQATSGAQQEGRGEGARVCASRTTALAQYYPKGVTVEHTPAYGAVCSCEFVTDIMG